MVSLDKKTCLRVNFSAAWCLFPCIAETHAEPRKNIGLAMNPIVSLSTPDKEKARGTFQQ